jgi:hypothetical protein
MIETAKWLIVGAVVFDCLYAFSTVATSFNIASFVLARLIQFVGWALMCISVRDTRWRVAAGVFALSMLIMSLEYFVSSKISIDDKENLQKYLTYTGILYYLSILSTAFAFPFISTVGTLRFKKSVYIMLLAVIAYFYMLYTWMISPLQARLDSNLYQEIDIFDGLLRIILSILMSAALYRMITLYEIGEGSSDQPIRLKKVFTSKSFFAILVFIVLTIFVLPILSQVN